MKLTAPIKLNPTACQAALLLATLERANAACHTISAWAWKEQTFRQYDLHKALYAGVKADFSLSAQMVVRALGKVAHTYKPDRKTQRTFRAHGAFPYDSRILRYFTDRQEVSIWTLGRRQRIPYVVGEHQRTLLAYQKGESDLVYRNGSFFLLATCDVPEEKEQATCEVLGVDLGIVELATDSGILFGTAGRTHPAALRKDAGRPSTCLYALGQAEVEEGIGQGKAV